MALSEPALAPESIEKPERSSMERDATTALLATVRPRGVSRSSLASLFPALFPALLDAPAEREVTRDGFAAIVVILSNYL